MRLRRKSFLSTKSAYEFRFKLGSSSHLNRTVAVSGTRYTFHPRFSKNVDRRACDVVLPPQGPAIRQYQEKRVRNFSTLLILYLSNLIG